VAAVTLGSSSPSTKFFIMTAPPIGTVEDLFSNETSAIVSFEDCKQFHPRFRFQEFEICPWLRKFKIIHNIKGQDDHATSKAVHKLYHVALDNQMDRVQMESAINVGETLAIVRPNAGSGQASIPVGAITFVAIGQKIVVLFFGVDAHYQSGGFGSQLLMLMGQCVKHRHRYATSGGTNLCISVFLYANQEENSKAWNFYTRRGFELAPQDPTETLQEFVSNPELNQFVCQVIEDLQLLCLKNFDTLNFGYASAAKAPLCFLLDPQRPLHGEVNDPMVYAQFPGTMSLADCNYCGHNMLFLQPRVDPLEEHATGPVGICHGYPKSQFVVSWSSRTEIKAGFTLLNPSVSMLLAWIQRDREARIWRDRITLLPTCVMVPLWNMHFLLLRFLEAAVLPETFDAMRCATFHPEFDNERFMGYAKVVLDFIYMNRTELFAKPYIVMFGENLTMDWTCYVSVNAGLFASEGAFCLVFFSCLVVSFKGVRLGNFSHINN
jgi:GNAT superfamily N-acetyltransferase